MTFRPEDHRGRERRWLLDLTWGGVTYRLAEESTEYTDSSGETFRYADGLVVAGVVERPVSVGTAPEAPTVPVELHLQGQANVPQRVAQGFPLGAARGVLWLWLEGTALRRRIVDGYLEAAEYGEEDQPVIGQLVDDRIRNRQLFPTANAKMGQSAQNPGEFYPWIIGAPGYDTGTAEVGYGSAALVYSFDSGANTHAEKLLVAGHPSTATQAWVLNQGTNFAELRNLAEEVDSEGRTVTVVDLFNSAPWAADDRIASSAYFVRWVANGLPIRGEDVNGAGDVLRWALERTDVAFDAGSLAAVLTDLNRYKIDTVMQAAPGQRIDLWDWVQRQLLPVLPLSLARNERGIAFVFWRWDARVVDAVAELAEGDNCHRIGDVGYASRDEVYSEFRLAYAPDAVHGRHGRTAVASGIPTTLSTDDAAVPNGDAKRAFRQYGRVIWEGSTDVVFDETTAAQIVRDKAAALATQPRHIGYTLPPDVGAALRPGDVVRLTDAGVYIDDELFFVMDVPADEGDWLRVHLREVRSR